MKSEDMGSYSKSCIEAQRFCMFWPCATVANFAAKRWDTQYPRTWPE